MTNTLQRTAETLTILIPIINSTRLLMGIDLLQWQLTTYRCI